jgi:hypothetical protein
MKSCYGYSKGGIVRPSKDADEYDTKHMGDVNDQHLAARAFAKGCCRHCAAKANKAKLHSKGVIGNGSGDTPDSDADDII